MVLGRRGLSLAPHENDTIESKNSGMHTLRRPQVVAGLILSMHFGGGALFPLAHVCTASLGLKLDDALVAERSDRVGSSSGALKQFGLSDFRQRIRAAYDNIDQLVQLKTLNVRQLRNREAFVAELQRLVDA